MYDIVNYQPFHSRYEQDSPPDMASLKKHEPMRRKWIELFEAIYWLERMTMRYKQNAVADCSA